MKTKIFTGLMLLAISVFFTSCVSNKDASAGKPDTKTNESKETFVEFSRIYHKDSMPLSDAQISITQMYSSKPFQLIASTQNKSVLIEEGVLIMEKGTVEKIIEFKDKLEGKVVSIKNGILLVQFDDGVSGKNVPPIPFAPLKSGFYQIFLDRNQKINYNGLIYSPSQNDIVLMIRYKERSTSGQEVIPASGLGVTGGTGVSPQQTPPSSSEGYREPQQQYSQPAENYQPESNPLMQNQNPTPAVRKPSSSGSVDPNDPN